MRSSAARARRTRLGIGLESGGPLGVGLDVNQRVFTKKF